MSQFRKYIQYYEKEFLADLTSLVAIPSVDDSERAAPNAPFGPDIRQAFDCFLAIAGKCGLETADFDGYACHASLGTSPDYIGVLGHLDVVGIGEPELWNTKPFTLTINGRTLYGRGVNDDKGPLLACLYALRILQDMQLPLKRAVRVIAGGAEETTWECMEHYFRLNPQPLMGFSPDGNFPIVNGEKGILKYDLYFPFGPKADSAGQLQVLSIDCSTLKNYVCDHVSICLSFDSYDYWHSFHGKNALSRNPAQGRNAIWKFAEYYKNTIFAQDGMNQMIAFLNTYLTNDNDGKKSGLFHADAQMGTTSVFPTGIQMDENGVHLYLDIRYPKSATEAELADRIGELAVLCGFEPTITLSRRQLYVSPTSNLIQCLKSSYHEVTGEEAALLTKGGASYARTMDHGVSFGATFEGEVPHSHFANECISLDSLKKAMEIYCRAIFYLANQP